MNKHSGQEKSTAFQSVRLDRALPEVSFALPTTRIVRHKGFSAWLEWGKQTPFRPRADHKNSWRWGERVDPKYPPWATVDRQSFIPVTWIVVVREGVPPRQAVFKKVKKMMNTGNN